MADNVQELIIELTLDNQQLKKELAKTQKQLGDTTKKANKTKGVFSDFSAVGGIFAGVIGGAVVGALKAFSSQGAKFEQTLVSFTTLFKGNAEQAKLFVKELQTLSAVTPFTQDQVLDAGKALKAFGIATNEVIPSLKRIGDISAGTGKNFNELAVIYGKARTQGTLFAEDINQLTEAGVPIIQEFAKQFGVTESEVKKLGSQGKITFANLEEGFRSLTEEGGQFFNLTNAQSKTFAGRISTLVSNLQILGTEIGLRLNTAAGDYVDRLIEITKNQQVVEKTIKTTVALIKLFALVMNNLTIPLRTIFGLTKIIAEDFQSIFNNLKDFGINIVDGVIEQFAKLNGTIQASIFPFKTLLQVGKLVFEFLGEKIFGFLKQFEFVNKGVEFVTKQFDKLGKAANNAFGKFPGIAKDAFDKLGEGEGTIDKIGKLLKNLGTETKEAYEETFLALVDLYNKSSDQIQKGQEDIVDGAKLTSAQVKKIQNEVAQLTANKRVKELELQRQQLETLKENLDLYGDQVLQSEEEIAEKQRLIQQQITDNQIKEFLERSKVAREYASSLVSTLSDLASTLVNIEQQKFNQIDEEDTKAKNKSAKKLIKLLKVEKGVRLAESVILGAVAVAKTMASLPFPINIPLAGAQTALSIAQTALIAKQKIPTVKEITGAQTGGVVKGGNGTLLNVAENGSSELLLNSGATGQKLLDDFANRIVNSMVGGADISPTSGTTINENNTTNNNSQNITVEVKGGDPQSVIDTINDYSRQFGGSDRGLGV